MDFAGQFDYHAKLVVPQYRIYELAGLPALQSSEPGQVRKEAATAIYASAGGKARLLFRVSAR